MRKNRIMPWCMNPSVSWAWMASVLVVVVALVNTDGTNGLVVVEDDQQHIMMKGPLHHKPSGSSSRVSSSSTINRRSRAGGTVHLEEDIIQAVPQWSSSTSSFVHNNRRRILQSTTSLAAEEALMGHNSSSAISALLQNSTAPNYYDILREVIDLQYVDSALQNGSTTNTTATTTNMNGTNSSTTPSTSSSDDSSSISSLYQVYVKETNTTYRLGDIKTYLPFTYFGQVSVNGAKENAMVALLAMYHFNNKDQSPILNAVVQQQQPSSTSSSLSSNTNSTTMTSSMLLAFLQNCNVRLTMELLDSEFSPTETTRSFTAVLQRSTSFVVPPPSAVVGPFRSAATSPLAILTGVNHLPHVGFAASSDEFDNKEQFPLYGRTVVSTYSQANVAIEYFRSIKSTHVAILFVTDGFGSTIQKNFQDAAAKVGIVTESIAVPLAVQRNSTDAQNVILALQRTSIRHVICFFFDTEFAGIMGAAVDANMVGPNYLYVFTALDVLVVQDNLKLKPGDPLIKAFQGAAIGQMQGGVLTQHLQSGTTNVSEATNGGAKPGSGFQRFLASYEKALSDTSFMNYVESLYPEGLDGIAGFNRSAPLASDPGTFGPFLYDAVTSLGISMCLAGSNTTFFTGEAIYQQFLNLQFQGASGNIQVVPTTGTRQLNTTTFIVWNTRVVNATDANGNAIIKFVPSAKYDGKNWSTIPGNNFQYADRTIIPPNSLPPADVNYSYIGPSGRIVGYALMGITGLSAALALLWLAYYRNEPIIESAQPVFLVLIAIGSVVMVSSIIPSGFEETVTRNLDALDRSCMATPWLYVMGISTALSGLYAKMRGIYQAYMNPELDFIHISSRNIIEVFAVVVSLNAIVMMVWSLVSPLQWTRTVGGATDVFNRPLDSHASCKSENANVFLATVICLNFLFLAVGNWRAYQSRNVETEYDESFYVGCSMAAILQAWLLGIPILIIVWSNPPSRFYVSSGIIFVTSQSVLSLVFLPKMFALRNQKLEEADPRKAYASYVQKSRRDHDDFSDDDIEPAADSCDDDLSDLPEASGNEPPRPSTRETDEVSTAEQSSSGKGLAKSKSEAHVVREYLATDKQAKDTISQSWSTANGANQNQKQKNHVAKGIKILHNPRASENLALAGGMELSRRQLNAYRDAPSRSQNSRSQQDSNANQPSTLVRADLDTVNEAEPQNGLSHTKGGN